MKKLVYGLFLLAVTCLPQSINLSWQDYSSKIASEGGRGEIFGYIKTLESALSNCNPQPLAPVTSKETIILNAVNRLKAELTEFLTRYISSTQLNNVISTIAKWEIYDTDNELCDSDNRTSYSKVSTFVKAYIYQDKSIMKQLSSVCSNYDRLELTLLDDSTYIFQSLLSAFNNFKNSNSSYDAPTVQLYNALISLVDYDLKLKPITSRILSIADDNHNSCVKGWRDANRTKLIQQMLNEYKNIQEIRTVLENYGIKL